MDKIERVQARRWWRTPLIPLLLLTGVEKVCLGFGTPEEKQLDSMTVEEATRYISENQFSSGAMLPKVEAAVSFASSSPARKSIIRQFFQNFRRILAGTSAFSLIPKAA